MVSDLGALVERLRAEIVELKRQLGRNSRNSSKPPASDSPFDKPVPTSLRRRSGRKPGGQPGHPGSTLALVDGPNERERHEPGPCTGCGADLGGAPEVGVERRQVFDLPPMTVRVTEHQMIARRCACGTTTCGTAPEGVTAPVQYGPRISAIILYLYVGQFLSKKRTAQAVAELFGTPVSPGTVATVTRRAADGLRDFLTVLRDRIAAAEVAGFDETGLRVAGTLHWVHCARTGKYTVITCHPKRGRKGMDDAGVLDRFRGVAVHDAWAPYDSYLDVEHQLCCAHVLRELQAVTDTAADADWCWATQAADALTAMQKLVAEAITAGADALDPETLAKQVKLYHDAARIGVTDTPPPHQQDHGQTQRPRPAAAQPPTRLPPLHHQLANTTRQQRIRTRHPLRSDQGSALEIDLLDGRSHAIASPSASDWSSPSFGLCAAISARSASLNIARVSEGSSCIVTVRSYSSWIARARHSSR